MLSLLPLNSLYLVYTMRGALRGSLWLSLALRHACAHPLDESTKLERRTDGDLCFINNHKSQLAFTSLTWSFTDQPFLYSCVD